MYLTELAYTEIKSCMMYINGIKNNAAADVDNHSRSRKT